MNRNRIIFLFITFFIFSSCQSNPFKREPDYDRISRSIIFKTAKKLNEEKNLQFIGFGGGNLNKQNLNISLVSHREMSFQKSRELIIYCIQTFLEEINNNENFRSCIRDYPFTPKNINFTIYYKDPETQKRFQPPLITLIYLSNGYIYFVIDENGKYKTVREETYEEALKIVQKENGINN